MLALLAAGQSRRFGDKDKLTAMLHGRMLGLHAAETLASLPFDQHVIIASAQDHPCAAGWRELGYEIVINEQADEGQSTSVRLAAQHAQSSKATALCICLADMPYISAKHIQRLLHAFQKDGQQETVASNRNGTAMPPAIFPPGRFAALQNLQGDQGARKLLDAAHLLSASGDGLIDIDTPEILAMENRKKRGD